MTTKAQEREALKKIMKIVAELGEDSYVATAFEGCFDIADNNITNDTAFSMKGRWEFAEKEREAAIDKVNKMRRDALEQAKRIAELEGKISILEDRLNEVKRAYNGALDDAMNERKDITIETTDGQRECKAFAKVAYFNNDGFRFINVVEKSGWTTSYKIADLKTLRIE